MLATTDAPVYFETPVKIGEETFVDGGVGGNCPLKQVMTDGDNDSCPLKQVMIDGDDGSCPLKQVIFDGL